MSTFSDALDKAKIGLILHKNSVFLSTIVFSLKHIEDFAIPTACTNGIELRINPTWFLEMTPLKRIGLLAHEAWHVAFDHITRAGDRHFPTWNKAADYVINNMLLDSSYELPDGGLSDPQYKGMSSEQVYAMLYSKEEEASNESYDMDISVPSDPEKVKEIQDQITEILIKATTQSRLMGDEPGTVPGDVEMAIEKLTNPVLPWNVILQDYFSAFASNDYSYRRPNKRFLPDYYLPRLYSEQMDHLVIAADISYSMVQSFPIFITEMLGIRETVNPIRTTIIPFDTAVKEIKILNQDEKIEDVLFTGGGGTNLLPVFEYLKDKVPTALLVFSDLLCRKIVEDPKYPVIWCCINNPKATVNFGKLIHLDTTKL
jgi:predicted metal-dependent peptidase